MFSEQRCAAVLEIHPRSLSHCDVEQTHARLGEAGRGWLGGNDVAFHLRAGRLPVAGIPISLRRFAPAHNYARSIDVLPAYPTHGVIR